MKYSLEKRTQGKKEIHSSTSLNYDSEKKNYLQKWTAERDAVEIRQEQNQ